MDPIFQFTDLSTHVQNCSNDECILPICVKWKLNIAKNYQKQLQQHKKREWNAIVSDARNKKKLRHNKELDEATALFFEDLEEIMKGDLGKRRPSRLATEIDAKNSFHASRNNPGCNQLHIGVDNNVNLTLNCQQNKSYEFVPVPSDKLAMRVLTGIGPHESTTRSLETQSFPLEMDKFIPNGDLSYRRPSSRTTATTATTKAAEKLPTICILKDNKLPNGDGSKLKKQAPIIQPNYAKKLWGILAEILQMIEEEGSVSEDSEAFCAHVLQKALAELQVRFFPSKVRKNKAKGEPKFAQLPVSK